MQPRMQSYPSRQDHVQEAVPAQGVKGVEARSALKPATQIAVLEFLTESPKSESMTDRRRDKDIRPCEIVNEAEAYRRYAGKDGTEYPFDHGPLHSCNMHERSRASGFVTVIRRSRLWACRRWKSTVIVSSHRLA